MHTQIPARNAYTTCVAPAPYHTANHHACKNPITLITAVIMALWVAMPSAAWSQGDSANPSTVSSKQPAPTEELSPTATLKLLTLKAPSVNHNLKQSPPLADHNPLEALMRPPLMALSKDDTWVCLLCAKPPELIHGNTKLRHHKLTIVLTLKPSLYWNDGKQVSALDIKHSIEHYNSRALSALGAHRIKVYAMQLAPKNPRVIRLVFPYQNRNHLASLAIPLLPAHLKEKFNGRRVTLATKGFAYGPYTQLSVKGNLIWLGANPYLKTPPNPSFKRVHFATVPTLRSARMEMDRRGYDGIVDFYPSIAQLNQIAGLPDTDRITISGHKQAVLVLNLRNPVFAKPARRRALRRLIQDAGLPAGLLPPGFGLSALSFAFPRGNGSAFWQDAMVKTEAMPAVEDDTWQNTPLELAIIDSPDRVAIAEAIRTALAATGVTLKIKRYKSKYFLNTVLRKGRFSTLALMMREGLPSSVYLENFHSRFVPRYPHYTGSNFGSWYNKSVNQWLYNQLYSDAQGFDALQRKIEEAYLTDVPEIPLFFWPKVMVTRGNLSQIPLGRNGFSPLLAIQKWRKLIPGPEVSLKSDQ